MTESLVYSDLNHMFFVLFFSEINTLKTDKYLPVKKIRVRKNDML